MHLSKQKANFARASYASVSCMLVASLLAGSNFCCCAVPASQQHELRQPATWHKMAGITGPSSIAAVGIEVDRNVPEAARELQRSQLSVVTSRMLVTDILRATNSVDSHTSHLKNRRRYEPCVLDCHHLSHTTNFLQASAWGPTLAFSSSQRPHGRRARVWKEPRGFVPAPNIPCWTIMHQCGSARNHRKWNGCKYQLSCFASSMGSFAQPHRKRF